MLLAVALVALIALNVSMVLPVMIEAGSRGFTDYGGLYLAGRIITDRQTQHMYDYAAQVQFQRQLFGVSRPGVPFNHPAYEALLFAPLSLLPFASSLYVWVLLNIFMLLVVAQLLRPFLAPSIPALNIAVFAVALAFAPVGIALMQGQDSILQLLLLTFAFVELKKGREFRAGCFLALALFKWHLVLPVIFLLLLRREWKAGQGFLTAAIVLVLISLAITGLGGAIAYFDLVRYTGKMLDIPQAMPNLRGIIAFFIPREGLVRALTVVLSAGLLLLPVASLPRVRDKRSVAFDLDFALMVTIAVLVGYHVYIHDLTLLLLPLVLVASFLFQRQQWVPLGCLGCFLLIQVYASVFGLLYAPLLTLPVLGFALLIWIESRRLVRCELQP